MRVRRIHIQSFGALSGYHADFSGHNMVLVYGDNEAGKSTVAEFLRSTMFPGKNAKYPISKKSDSGMLELIMDDGGTRILQRDQKKVVERDGKLLPATEIRLDAETYRSLFGLDLEQLGNDKVITTGDLKRRFLTVPGGENVPEVSRIIRAEMDNLMTKERVTDSKIIGKYRKEVKNLDQEIAEKEEAVEEYGSMIARLEELNEQLNYAHDAQETVNYVRNRELVRESLRENIAYIESMKQERQELAYSELLSDEDVIRYNYLRHRLDKMDERVENLDEEAQEVGPITRERAEQILSMEDEIENVWGLKARLDILSSGLEDLTEMRDEDQRFIVEACESLGITEAQVISIESDPTVHELLLNPKRKKVVSAKVVRMFSRGKRILYSLASAAAMAAGFIVDSPVLASVSLAAGIAVNVLPSAFEMYFHIDNIDWDTWIPERGFPEGTTRERASDMLMDVDRIHDRIRRRDLSDSRIERYTEESEAIKESMYSVIRPLGIDTGNIFGDLNEMYSQYRIAFKMTASSSKADEIIDEREEVEREFNALVGKYGGEEAMERMRLDREKLRLLDSNLNALVKAVESATVRADEILSNEVGAVEEASQLSEETIKDRIDEINQEIGHMAAEIAAIRGDTSIDELRYARSVQNERYVNASKRWAVLSLADTIINECCDHFYSRLQPTVVRTANRYLHLMTCGRYQIIADPRSSDLIIEDRMGRKSLSEWSAGLGDQVLLSIKMAIAKELTDESVPFIMDDVLVRFDRDRKQGACRAIMEFARDQQVIMFTCDRYLESAFRLEGDIKYMEM